MSFWSLNYPQTIFRIKTEILLAAQLYSDIQAFFPLRWVCSLPAVHDSRSRLSSHCNSSSKYSDITFLGKGRCHQSSGRGCMDAALEMRSTTFACATASSLGNMMEKASPMRHSTPIKS